jgi:hypothetical protein
MGNYRETPAGRAEDHMSDLSMVSAIMVLCESSLFRTRSGRSFESRIVALCKRELQRQLVGLDRARERLRDD